MTQQDDLDIARATLLALASSLIPSPGSRIGDTSFVALPFRAPLSLDQATRRVLEVGWPRAWFAFRRAGVIGLFSFPISGPLDPRRADTPEDLGDEDLAAYANELGRVLPSAPIVIRWGTEEQRLTLEAYKRWSQACRLDMIDRRVRINELPDGRAELEIVYTEPGGGVVSGIIRVPEGHQ